MSVTEQTEGRKEGEGRGSHSWRRRRLWPSLVEQVKIEKHSVWRRWRDPRL